MTKTLCILVVGLIFESIGLAFLSKGLKQIGEPAQYTIHELLGLLGRGATNPNILIGVFFEAVFFGTLLTLMSQKDVSLVLPLTSLGFLITALMAKFILHEEVTALRWFGIGLIVLGTGLVSLSEQSKKQTQGSKEKSPSTQPLG